MTTRHPAIFQIGTVTDDGTTVTIAHWGLSICSVACHCHKHPTGGHMAIKQNQPPGTLGLVSYKEDCTCCTPWTEEELIGVLRDFQDIDSIPTMDGERT